MGARLIILAAALAWSTAGVCIKLSDLDAWQLAGGRSLVAAATLFLLLPGARRLPNRREAWVAAAYAATVTLFVIANKLTTAANAIFIQDTAPLYVLLLSPWLLGERPSRAELLAAPVFVGGVLLFFVDQLQAGQMAGNVVALGSGVAFAFTIMGLRKLETSGALLPSLPSPPGQHRHSAGVVAAAWGNVLAFALTAPIAAGGPAPTPLDVSIILFLGVFQLGLAYALFARGVRQVPAAEASLLVLLEPVASATWAFLFVGERPGPWAVAGGTVVILATVWRTFAAPRARAPVAVP